MPSSSRTLRLAALLALAAPASTAWAQQQPQGFALERFYSSAPTGGWLVMDDLDIHGRLGGAVAVTLGYAHDPLVVSDGVHRLAVVGHEAFAEIGAAITWDRWRFYLDLDMPFVIDGHSGTVGDYTFSGPSLNLGSNPDALADVRFGVDVRIVGKPGGRFRFGAGVQLLEPNGVRADYDGDDTFRGMIRALVAGDLPWFTYAGQLGVHIRPLDDSPVPGSPKGSELLFGAAAGAKLPLGRGRPWVAVVGPEVFGATAFRSFLTSNGSAFEGLLTGRIEGTCDDRMQVRVKLGVGGGLVQHFGAPDWRVLVGVEMFNHRARPSR